jgi:hypothetical protein
MEKMLLKELWVEWRKVTNRRMQPIVKPSPPPLGPEDMAAE